MIKFKKEKTGISGLFIIESIIFSDERGFFMETYSERDFHDIGINEKFVQDNHSKSKKGVLRGLHFQTSRAQGKLVRVTRGGVLDVVVDIRKDSTTFGNYYSVELTEENRRQLYIPAGFAHGYLTLQDDTELLYKCTDYYAPEFDSGILWEDEDLNIEWNLKKYGLCRETITLSEKDKNQQSLKEFKKSQVVIK